METFSALLALCAGNSTHKCQWCETLMFSLICIWINGWVNNREAGDLRRHCAHYDVIVMNKYFVNTDTKEHDRSSVKYNWKHDCGFLLTFGAWTTWLLFCRHLKWLSSNVNYGVLITMMGLIGNRSTLVQVMTCCIRQQANHGNNGDKYPRHLAKSKVEKINTAVYWCHHELAPHLGKWVIPNAQQIL